MTASGVFLAVLAALLSTVAADVLLSEVPCQGGTAQQKYTLVFEGLWSAKRFPKQYPIYRPKASWSSLVGVTHNGEYTLWHKGETASEGVKLFAEQAGDWKLFAEFTSYKGISGKFFADEIKNKGVGERKTDFVIDADHSKVSFMVKIVPSPDWFVGLDSKDLCQNGKWIDRFSSNLGPWDAGTDKGFTFTSPNWATVPQEPVFQISSKYPNHPANSFYYPALRKLPALARVTLTRDGADLAKLRELAEIVEEAEEEPEVISMDCEVSRWSAFTRCSRSCGGGVMSRSRYITQKPVNGGKACPGVSETTQCNVEPCPERVEVVEVKPESEPKVEPDRKTKDKAESETGVEAKSETEVQPESETEVEPESKAQVKPEGETPVQPKSKIEVKPESKAQVKPKGETEVKTEGKTKVKPESETKVKPESETKVQPESKTELKAESKMEDKPESEKEVKTGSKPQTKPESKTKVKPESETEVKTESKTKVRPESETEVEPERETDVVRESTTEVQPESETVVEPEIIPLDCEVSRWSAFSRCSKSCGGGVKFRSRRVYQKAQNGGKPCPALSEMKQCHVHACPVEARDRPEVVHCRVSRWSRFSRCSRRCGGGITTRSRYIIQRPQNGGRSCPRLAEMRQCNLTPCPVPEALRNNDRLQRLLARFRLFSRQRQRTSA